MSTGEARLQKARMHLAAVEAKYSKPAALRDLQSGLGLLEDAVAVGAPAEVRTAYNLAATYAQRVHTAVANHLKADPAVTEPDLEHLFKLVLVFDDFDFPAHEHTAALKVELARRLIERYLEGHAPSEKQAAVAQLLSLSKGTPRRVRE